MGNRAYQLVALPGEGVGLEVVEAALAVLAHLATLHGFSVRVVDGLVGEPALQRFGVGFPEATARLCEGTDGILFGAVSKAGLLELRKRFDLFANLRPVRPVKSLRHRSSIKPEKLDGVDILFVRELVSGIYFGPSGRGVDGTAPYGFHTMQYADSEIRRIARVALQQAQQRRKKLAIAHKENALPCLPWTRLVQEEAAAFPDVTLVPMLMDNLAMQLVMNPQQFDVILAGNLFGDILSDIGGAIAGSIGLLGSASLNADGFGMYEAIHGTAPDIAGKGIANPMGTLASVELMLRQWGEQDAADHLAIAQEQLLEAGYRTADLITSPEDKFVNTKAFTEQLIQQLTNTQSYERT
ncbi:isocitrate/isopropylmalate family dehydrogenase [Leptolyngbya sp. O-77]|uniref:isocitrate/isopropylmalate family dehydrogenase n=1 Tax=Leptolyngbya sp. O-77 TaxID=1080068 RepID=UPI00074D3E78|nr:isocitrate/isopropylmalate family dehydrogenase [Leptolyngbya sp. O-77]BAU44223.1 3-isopropylmalate dehydrogenase [Leptolyngbya sp. O-77]